jgi:hypothetical protein
VGAEPVSTGAATVGLVGPVAWVGGAPRSAVGKVGSFAFSLVIWLAVIEGVGQCYRAATP